MKIKLFAGPINLGIVESKIIDYSMSVVGGILQPSTVYFLDFQSFFKLNTQQPNWQALANLDLRGLLSHDEILECEGGICITDIEGFADINVEFCGLNQRVMNMIR
jgi:hypothetical protein